MLLCMFDDVGLRLSESALSTEEFGEGTSHMQLFRLNGSTPNKPRAEVIRTQQLPQEGERHCSAGLLRGWEEGVAYLITMNTYKHVYSSSGTYLTHSSGSRCPIRVEFPIGCQCFDHCCCQNMALGRDG